MLLTLFLVATATFFLMHAVPGQPFELSRETPDSVREAMEAKMGLDKPLFEQYLIYMKNLLHGDFGIGADGFPQKGKKTGDRLKIIHGDTSLLAAVKCNGLF